MNYPVSRGNFSLQRNVCFRIIKVKNKMLVDDASDYLDVLKGEKETWNCTPVFFQTLLAGIMNK